MSDGNRFFDQEQHEASRLKIEAYGKYLQPLAYKVLHYHRRLWVVDAFAGAGRYMTDADGRAADGSPVVAARFARQYNVNNANRGKQIHLINVEKDPATFARLQEALAPFGPVSTNFQGRFQDRLEQILELVRREPVFFFIDPFGMEGADIRLVEEILRKRGGQRDITELLIHFSDRTLARLAGHDADSPRSAVGQRASDSKVAYLDAVLGTTWWRGAFANPSLDTFEARSDAVASLYIEQLRQRGISHVHELRMRDSLDAAPRYRLIFTTRSAHGSFLMSDIAAKHEENLFNARWEGTFEIDWELQKRTERRDQLRGEIHRWGLDLGHASFEDALKYFAPEKFGEWRTSDYAACLRELVTLGGIDRRRGTAGITEKEQLNFVPTIQESLFARAADE
jgi:three-Cys-motif partner protein